MAFSLSAFGITEDELPSGWFYDRLDTLALLNPEQINSVNQSSEIVYLDIANVAAGVFERPTSLHFADAPSRARRIVRSNDTILSTVRPGNRAYAFMRKIPVNLIVSTGFAVIRPIPKAADPRYVYYIVTSDPIIDYLTSIAEEKTTYPSINPSDIAECVVPIPPLPEQRAIAHILGTLDDKIELNRKMNETLEAMARAIFKSWFVDFDPVRAKMEGRDTGLPKEIAELFPDKLVESELGKIPEGWRVGTIIDCCIQIQNGGTPKRNVLNYWTDGKIPWLTSGEVRQPIILATDNFITEIGLKESSAKWVSAKSTVIALYGATAGQVSFISSKLTTNQAVCALIPKKNYEFFNYFWMRSVITDLESYARGSAQQNISKGIVEQTPVIVSNEYVLEKFNELVNPLLGRWIANLHESRTLAALRDALLPKLISGEVRIKDAERFWEATL